MTIEKEAREIPDDHWCDEHVGKDCLIYDELKSYKKQCKAKQDRIEDLESALKKCVSALEFASTKTDHMNETDDCAVCKKIDSALDRAKKAIGGGK